MEIHEASTKRHGPGFFLFLILIFVIVIGGLMIAHQAFIEHFVFRDDPSIKRNYREFMTVKVNVPEQGSDGARARVAAADQSNQSDQKDNKQRETYDPDGPAPGMDAPPFSKETLAVAARVLSLWNKNANEQGKWTGALKELDDKEFFNLNIRIIKIDEIDYATLKPLLEQNRELIDAFLAVVSRPDYEIDALGKPGVCDENGDLPMPNFLIAQTCAKILRLQAFMLAHEGKFKEALKTCELAVRAARVSGYSILISQLIGVAVNAIGVRTWIAVVGQCTDPALLRRTLERQNVLRKQSVFMPADVPVVVLDHLGVIHELQRRGLKVEYQGLTAQQLTARTAEARVDYLERIARPAIANDPEMQKKVDASIANYQSQSENSGGRAYSIKGAFRKFGASFVRPILFAIAQPNMLEARNRADVSRAYFDLLRAETARRIFQLEKGVAPVRLADVSPQYLPEVPGDVFTASKIVDWKIVSVSAEISISTSTQTQTPARDPSVLRAPATLREAPEHYYSIGPDRKDDGGALLYDPTNGTISRGDIWLNRVSN